MAQDLRIIIFFLFKGDNTFSSHQSSCTEDLKHLFQEEKEVVRISREYQKNKEFKNITKIVNRFLSQIDYNV